MPKGRRSVHHKYALTKEKGFVSNITRSQRILRFELDPPYSNLQDVVTQWTLMW